MAGTRDVALEAKIGFDRVRKTISDRCRTEYAVERVAGEDFSTVKSEILERLLLTDEMRLILMFEETFPTDGYIDCIPFLSILKTEGSNIDLLSLGRLRTVLDTMLKITSFFHSIKDGVYPNLKRAASSITIFPEISRKIDSIIDKHGEVKDSASDDLFEIRKSLKEKEGAITKRIASILKKAQQEGIVSEDATVSIRDGKMLIPVSTANKRKLQGFVYDESATGKTTYMEPAEIVELENDISELHFAESREIAKILSDFSDFLRPYVPSLLDGAKCLGEFDFLMAKAQTALEYIAGVPIISENGEMNLRKARHPLLEKALSKEGKQIVPLTLTLTPEKHILMISGPNAGGKSVCLKTVGLLQYMFQWGMLIPTSETSEMVVFDRIMADIGDGQSIDNDLSTYSSFLLSMKNMLEAADKRTLVLIDEFGSGTEPAAGGAIAEAILSEFDKRGVYGVITTHYTNLKLYASREGSGVVNGAMLFDAAKIEPLFKLEMGLPGNSFAFELARKTGLPESVVKNAEEISGEQFVDMERDLKRIARRRKALDEKLQRVRTADKTLESITGKYQKELEEIKTVREDILSQAREEAQQIVKDANKKVENTIRSIKESQAEKDITLKARRELQSFVEAISEKKAAEQKDSEDYIEQKIEKLNERNRRRQERKERRAGEKEKEEREKRLSEEKRMDEFRNGPLKVGEKVRLKRNGMVGEVSKVSPRSVTVIIGNITSQMSPDGVERISSNEFKNAVKESGKASAPRTYEDSSISERKLSFKPEIDIRGQRVSEALDSVMRYVDDAIMLNVPSVRIITGKGTGALREEVQKFLRATPGVASVKDEDIHYGGTGVTVVTFE